jgi:hypothetical protein
MSANLEMNMRVWGLDGLKYFLSIMVTTLDHIKNT